ncbi:MAG: hypothetical protein N2662_09400 [Bacteroidales bacterium]|nr:hypothetical protein [Bacteroidales bacterium]
MKDNQKLIVGLMHYLGATALKKYPYLFQKKKLLCFSDTLGLNLLVQCSQSTSVYARTESLYFLVKIYLEIESNFPKAYFYSTQLINLFPENIIFGYNHLTLLSRMNKIQEYAILKTKLLSEITKNNDLISEQKTYLYQLINTI